MSWIYFSESDLHSLKIKSYSINCVTKNVSLSVTDFIKVIICWSIDRNVSIDKLWFRNGDHYQFVSVSGLLRTDYYWNNPSNLYAPWLMTGPWVMVLYKIIMVTNPESFMKIRTIQKLDRFYKSVVVKSDWLLLCQLSKKIIETMSNHSWNRKCPTKWRISYKSISNATLFKKTNLDHEFHWLKMNFEFDWKCFDIDEKLVVMMQSLRTKVRMSFYWNTF